MDNPTPTLKGALDAIATNHQNSENALSVYTGGRSGIEFFVTHDPRIKSAICATLKDQFDIELSFDLLEPRP